MDVLTDLLQRSRARGAAFAHTTVHGDWGVRFPAGPRVSVHAIVRARRTCGPTLPRTRRGWRRATSCSCASPSATTWPTCRGRRASRSTTSRSTRPGAVASSRATARRPSSSAAPTTSRATSAARRSMRCRRPSGCARRPAARCARRWTCSAARCCTTRRASRRCSTGCSTSRWCRSCASTSPRRTRAPPPWFRASGDPHLGAALRAMHAEPARQWTVADLAAEATLSRSAFARRFTEQLGVGPLAYLTEWRMASRASACATPTIGWPRSRTSATARSSPSPRPSSATTAPPGPLAHGEARRRLTCARSASLHADAVVEDVDDRLLLGRPSRATEPASGTRSRRATRALSARRDDLVEVLSRPRVDGLERSGPPASPHLPAPRARAAGSHPRASSPPLRLGASGMSSANAHGAARAATDLVQEHRSTPSGGPRRGSGSAVRAP